MKKVISVIGVRPEFVRSKLIFAELSKYFNHKVVHTGQHYDYLMSKVFFDEMAIPEPDYHLNVRSSGGTKQTAESLVAIDRVLAAELPVAVIVHGDSNSTLAGALAAVYRGIPVVHVEAGMRSGEPYMKEEINRKIVDHISSIFFCSSPRALNNLKSEGIFKNAFVSGDLMRDVLIGCRIDSSFKKKLGLQDQGYFFLTIHRAENTEDLENFKKMIKVISTLDAQVIFPVHPRTRKLVSKFKLGGNLRVIEPVSYSQSISLITSARAVITDSGGIQREAYWLAVPCFTLRLVTEWVETVEAGWNQVVLNEIEKLPNIISGFKKPKKHPSLYGRGEAAVFISKKLNAILNG